MGVKTSRVMTMTTFRLKHYGGPMPEEFANYCPYKEVSYNNLILSTRCGDSCIQVGSSVGLIRNILCDDAGADVVLLVEPYRKLHNFFTKPLDSSLLNIYSVWAPWSVESS